jgi:hypothetical protein
MLELVDAVFDAIFGFFANAGSSFYGGMAIGVVLAIISALIYREVIHDLKSIRFFFATIDPSLKSSPSGFARMLGCMGGLLRLSLIFIFLSLMSVGCLRSLAVP